LDGRGEILAAPGASDPDTVVDENEGDGLDPQLVRPAPRGLHFGHARGTRQQRADAARVHSCFAGQGGEGVQASDVLAFAPESPIQPLHHGIGEFAWSPVARREPDEAVGVGCIWYARDAVKREIDAFPRAQGGKESSGTSLFQRPPRSPTVQGERLPPDPGANVSGQIAQRHLKPALPDVAPGAYEV
jgi:hypothetical protein